jgi:response regulator RpfG family c-di-GMP phosphodiesterase
MAHILLIDSNPDNRKSLEGLLRYRTQHKFNSVATHTDGARKAVSLLPDIIMMNVLLFMKKQYAFPRVLQQHEKTQHISFLVHATGPLDEVTEKQIQASGLATIIYLPASAEEIESGIQEALDQSSVQQPKGVAPVIWPQANPNETPKTTRSTPQKISKVKTVQWPVVSNTNEEPRPTPRPKRKASLGFRVSTFEEIETESEQTFKTPRWKKVDPKDVKNK